MSKHFERMWLSVQRSIDIAMEECDPIFMERCNPTRLDKKEGNFSHMVEVVYRRIRDELKQECYGTKEGAENMDARKIASVMCCALMENQVVRFDAEVAAKIIEEKNALLVKQETNSDRTELNRWIVNNFFINYKIAYLTGLFIVFDSLLSELTKNTEALPFVKKLAEQGQLNQYPVIPKVDGFDVSMVLGLGRAGMQQKRVDGFLLALQFYQIEMYTRNSIGMGN